MHIKKHSKETVWNCSLVGLVWLVWFGLGWLHFLASVDFISFTQLHLFFFWAGCRQAKGMKRNLDRGEHKKKGGVSICPEGGLILLRFLAEAI